MLQSPFSPQKGDNFFAIPGSRLWSPATREHQARPLGREQASPMPNHTNAAVFSVIALSPALHGGAELLHGLGPS